MKNPLYKTIFFLNVAWIVLVVGLAFKTDSTGLAQNIPETTNETQRIVSVTGIGKINAPPDIAVIRLGVETEAEDATNALTANNEISQAILDALIEAGIAEDDIQTQNVSLFPRYDQSPDFTGRGEFIGYTARNIIQVKAREIDNTGEILDTAVQEGANIVESIQFEVSDPEEMLSLAREAAMKDAQQKANQLVTLAGAELGPVLTIQEFSSTPIQSEQLESVAAVGSAVPISPGTESIQVQVSVTWLLQSAMMDTESETTPTPTP